MPADVSSRDRSDATGDAKPPQLSAFGPKAIGAEVGATRPSDHAAGDLACSGPAVLPATLDSREARPGSADTRGTTALPAKVEETEAGAVPVHRCAVSLTPPLRYVSHLSSSMERAGDSNPKLLVPLSFGLAPVKSSSLPS